MGLAKYDRHQEKKKLEQQVIELENKKVNGWIANMAKHYEIKKLKTKIKEIEKSLPTQK